MSYLTAEGKRWAGGLELSSLSAGQLCFWGERTDDLLKLVISSWSTNLALSPLNGIKSERVGEKKKKHARRTRDEQSGSKSGRETGPSHVLDRSPSEQAGRGAGGQASCSTSYKHRVCTGRVRKAGSRSLSWL